MMAVKSYASNNMYDKYILIQELDEKNLQTAKDLFDKNVRDGVIIEGSFDNNVWTLTNECKSISLNFNFNEVTYIKRIRNLLDCNYKYFRDMTKAFIVFNLGTFSLDILRSILRGIKKILYCIENDIEIVNSKIAAPQQLIIFFEMFPVETEYLNIIIENLQEIVENQRFKKIVHSQRTLANFQSYFRFNDLLYSFWNCKISEKEWLFYFPVYFWWNLTGILPLRPSEFLLTPRNCLRETSEGYQLKIRRTKQKSSFRKVYYKINQDYSETEYIIPNAMALTIKKYIILTDYLPDNDIATLLRTDPHYNYLIKQKRTTTHYTYYNLSTCLKTFYHNILHAENGLILQNTEKEKKHFLENNEIEVIRLGDTRHIAMINLIISGGSPVICKELAAHSNISISSHYYANISNLIECMTYEKYRMIKKRGKDIQYHNCDTVMDTYSLNKIKIGNGWCHSNKYINSQIEDCLENIGLNGEIGECNYCRFYSSSEQFSFKLDEQYVSVIQDDCSYLQFIIELVRHGNGELDDIRKVLLKLQTSSALYSEHLIKQYSK